MSSEDRGTESGKVDVEKVIEELIEGVAKELRATERQKPLHTLVTDLMRLVEARKQVEPERVREVTVRWIGLTSEKPFNG